MQKPQYTHPNIGARVCTPAFTFNRFKRQESKNLFGKLKKNWAANVRKIIKLISGQARKKIEMNK